MSNKNQNKNNQNKNNQNKNNQRADNRVLLSHELNAELFTITTPKKPKGSDRIISFLLQDSAPIYSETPWLRAPFGISGFKPKGSDKLEWSINLSASALDDIDNNLVSTYFEQWERADEQMLDHGIQYSSIIFGKEYKASQREVVTVLYTPVIKGKDKPEYPLRIQPKISKMRDEKDKSLAIETAPNISVFMEGCKEAINVTTFEELSNLVPKNGYVKAIIQPKTWYIAGKFGLSLNLLQLLVRKEKRGRPTGYAFSVSNSDEENEGLQSNPESNHESNPESNHESNPEPEPEKNFESYVPNSDDENEAEGEEEEVEVEGEEEVEVDVEAEVEE